MADDDGKEVQHFNCHLLCGLCRGYLVDATTITECLHSFCRSCVVRHVEKCHTCPSCAVELSSSKPYSQLKRDHTLQTIVYKLVPSLARTELRSRLEHRTKHGMKGDVSSLTEDRFLESFFSPTDSISLSLNYVQPGHEVALARSIFTYRLRQKEKPEPEATDTRYFLCPAALPIGLLMKFLINKYEVDTDVYHVEILYNGQPLLAEYKLLDVAYIFSWKQKEPLKLWFSFVQNGSGDTPPESHKEVKETPPKRRRTSVLPKSAKRKRISLNPVRKKKTLRAGRESHMTSPPDETTPTANETTREGDKIPAEEDIPNKNPEVAEESTSDADKATMEKASAPDSVPDGNDDSVNITTVRMQLNRKLQEVAEVPDNGSAVEGSVADPPEVNSGRSLQEKPRKETEGKVDSSTKSAQNPQIPVSTGESPASVESDSPKSGRNLLHPPVVESRENRPREKSAVVSDISDHLQNLPVSSNDSGLKESGKILNAAKVSKTPLDQHKKPSEQPVDLLEKNGSDQASAGTSESAGPVTSSPLPDKSKPWLPKTVFDLDDSSLFALRLRRNLTADADSDLQQKPEQHKVYNRSPLTQCESKSASKTELGELMPKGAGSNLQQKQDQIEVTQRSTPQAKGGLKSASKAKRGELILTIADSIFESKRLKMNDSQPALAPLSVAVHDPHGQNRNKPQRTDSIGALDLTRPVTASPLPAAKAPPSPCRFSPEAAGRISSSPRISGPHPFFLSPGAAYNSVSHPHTSAGILRTSPHKKTDQERMRDFLNFISLQKTCVKGKEIPPLKRLDFGPKPMTSPSTKESVSLKKIRAPPGLLRIPQVVPRALNGGQDSLLVPSSSAVQNKR